MLQSRYSCVHGQTDDTTISDTSTPIIMWLLKIWRLVTGYSILLRGQSYTCLKFKLDPLHHSDFIAGTTQMFDLGCDIWPWCKFTPNCGKTFPWPVVIGHQIRRFWDKKVFCYSKKLILPMFDLVSQYGVTWLITTEEVKIAYKNTWILVSNPISSSWVSNIHYWY